MKENVNDLKPGMMMLVIKNDNGTFSRFIWTNFKAIF